MSDSSTYVIRGGIPGRERLRILAGVMAPTTNGLLDRLGDLTGRRCLDAGCGGGDVTRELARRAGPGGHVVGIDLDSTKLALCREETAALGNIEFRAARIGEDDISGPFDVVYSRFLLTHLPDPTSAVRQFHEVLPPGGLIALEDIDFSGYFTHPFSAAHQRFADLQPGRAVARRGPGYRSAAAANAAAARLHRYQRLGGAADGTVGRRQAARADYGGKHQRGRRRRRPASAEDVATLARTLRRGGQSGDAVRHASRRADVGSQPA